jgi:putative membrane protein
MSQIMRKSEFINKIILSAAMAGVVLPGALAQNAASGGDSSTGAATQKLSAADRAFIKKAAAGGLAEVELGQLAVQKAASQDVKQFGQRMVDDHSKANDQLKQVASSKGVAVPDKLEAKDAATKAKLEKLSGEQFDRAYMQDMVMDHTKDVSEFRTESKTAKDPDVKSFASQTLPTLQDHLKQAKAVAPSSAKKSAANATGGAQ